MMRLVAYIPQPNPRKLGNMPWNAVIRLAHRRPVTGRRHGAACAESDG
jgi:hypothetical protein